MPRAIMNLIGFAASWQYFNALVVLLLKFVHYSKILLLVNKTNISMHSKNRLMLFKKLQTLKWSVLIIKLRLWKRLLLMKRNMGYYGTKFIFRCRKPQKKSKTLFLLTLKIWRVSQHFR